MTVAEGTGRKGRPLWLKIVLLLSGSFLAIALLITAILTMTPAGRQATGTVRGLMEISAMRKNPAMQPTTELGKWQQSWTIDLKDNFTRLQVARVAFPKAAISTLETTGNPDQLAFLINGIDTYDSALRGVRAADQAILAKALDDLDKLNLPASVRDGLRLGLNGSLKQVIDAMDPALAAEDDYVTALSSQYGFLKQLQPGVGYTLKDGHLVFKTTADLKEFQSRAAHTKEMAANAKDAMEKAKSQMTTMQQNPLGAVLKIMQDQTK